MAERLLKIKESADQLNVSDRTMWDWVYQRKVESVRIGRSVRIRQSSIDKLIEQGTTPAKGD